MSTAAALIDAPREPAAFYVERRSPELEGLDAFAVGLLGRARDLLPLRWASPLQAVQAATALADEAAACNDDALRARLRQHARCAVQQGGATLVSRAAAADLAWALAAVREAAVRSLGMRPYDTQLLGAALLLRGRLAEMQTGEGKTLTAGLGAALVASAGLPVHVITVNDYLAERDGQKLAPLLNWLGLSMAPVLTGMSPDERRRAYACDVTYVTGKEVVFDYLKDKVACGAGRNALQLRMSGWVAGGAAGQGKAPATLLRGLHFAIVDEADSIFIDEARTPLILSVQAEAETDTETFAQGLALAHALQPGRHYKLREGAREVELTDAGRDAVADLSADLGPAWQARQAREHLARQALRALHLYRRDQQYIVKDCKVLIVDEQTGRAMPGRSWEQGLHQMIETKEGVGLSDRVRTVARITYQRFFRRYLRLSGMTGTAREVRGELWRVYGLHTVAVPTHRPGQRQVLAPSCLPDAASKWQAVCDSVEHARAQGRPVLVGTRSVEASMRVSQALALRGIPARLLNALHDAAEGALVEDAGQAGLVTVATNMAGRGTDIGLGPGVHEAGGLHVILTEFHESRRVDRQLFGRTARQGDPGSAQAIVSLEDALIKHHAGLLPTLLAPLLARPGAAHSLAVGLLRRWCQGATERQHLRQRRAAMAHDRQVETLLSFSGRN
jgi:preprotein translocase subunit SecA